MNRYHSYSSPGEDLNTDLLHALARRSPNKKDLLWCDTGSNKFSWRNTEEQRNLITIRSLLKKKVIRLTKNRYFVNYFDVFHSNLKIFEPFWIYMSAKTPCFLRQSFITHYTLLKCSMLCSTTALAFEDGNHLPYLYLGNQIFLGKKNRTAKITQRIKTSLGFFREI